MENLKQIVNTYFNLVFKVGIVLVILATLFLFTNLTTEFYDTPKFVILLTFVGLILILWALRTTFLGKVVFVRTPLDLPLILLLSVAVVSTFASSAPYVSLLGLQTKIHGSLISIVIYAIFYFLLTNNLKGTREVRFMLFLTTLAGALLSGVTLLVYSGAKILPAPWTHSTNFTPTGLSFTTAAILVLLLPLVLSSAIQAGKLPFKVLNSFLLLVFGATIALTGSLSTWVAGALALFLTVWVVNPIRQISLIGLIRLIGLIVPAVFLALVIVLSFIPPIGGRGNPLYTQAKNFPREIQLSLIPSWKVSVSSFRDMPFWGTGPATFFFNFTAYKPIEFNQSKFWNLRFDTSFNEYLQVLASLGGIGLLALLSLTVLFINSAYRILRLENHQLPKALAISGIAFFTILSMHTSTLPLMVMGLFILASFFVLDVSESVERSWKNVLILQTSEETVRIDALPAMLLIISLVLVLFTFYFGGKFAYADYHHRLALNAVAQNQGVIAYNGLIAAEKLNPYADLYRTDLAQVNFALANAIATSKAPSEAFPEGSLSDQDKQNIQVLLQQSIAEGRTAVTLSPRSAVNWEVLALLYRQISGVAQNALLFSLDSYGRTIIQDPLNPILRLNVGGVYYAVGNFDLAIRFFTDAINLKPDFANGYYNLSVALRDKGDLNSALQAAQKVVELVDKDSADYKVATDYLNDLKSKVSPPTPEQPPAAQTTGALQQKELPKVINLPKPEKIATPEAIKKPSPTPAPKIP